MSTTHVFIVDVTTFNLHLQYLFAGTGAKNAVVDFNSKPNSKLHYATENNLVGLLADSQRIRRDDFVVFYLQQNIAAGIPEGKFFGVFQASQDLSFLDQNDSAQFLRDDLQKSLTFRTLIKPWEVYAKGVTEWEALDEIKHIQAPSQMLWSLIYRKLKGNRGNTMITIYESERLFKLLRDKNSRQVLSSQELAFNAETQEIQAGTSHHAYAGRRVAIDIMPRLANKYRSRLAFETHLQAYITQNLGRGTDAGLDKCLACSGPFEWLGNEVSCGVGMQRIDVMLSCRGDRARIVVPIELKAVEASDTNVRQLGRYVDWLQQYYIPNRVSDIQPVLVAKRTRNKATVSYHATEASFRAFNSTNASCLPLKFVEYELVGDSLQFTQVQY